MTRKQRRSVLIGMCLAVLGLAWLTPAAQAEDEDYDSVWEMSVDDVDAPVLLSTQGGDDGRRATRVSYEDAFEDGIQWPPQPPRRRGKR